MELSEYSKGDQRKLQAIIKKALDGDKGLVLISKMLQKKGLSNDAAKELIKKEALYYWENQRRKAIGFLLLGLAGMIYVILSIAKSPVGEHELYGFGLFISGLILYFRNRKRLKYLKSILDK
ncbi:MAG: hypothetical protein ACJA0U_001803 [Salibacteraceae bacterium]|jgi:hypothetical protein